MKQWPSILACGFLCRPSTFPLRDMAEIDASNKFITQHIVLSTSYTFGHTGRYSETDVISLSLSVCVCTKRTSIQGFNTPGNMPGGFTAFDRVPRWQHTVMKVADDQVAGMPCLICVVLYLADVNFSFSLSPGNSRIDGDWPVSLVIPVPGRC